MLHLQDDTNALSRAVCVNRTWFHQGVGLLWARPAEHAFTCVAPSSGRRQLYASLVTELSDMHGVSAADGLRFPNARAITFCQVDWLLAMLPLVNPHVENFSIWSYDAWRARAAAKSMALPFIALADANGDADNRARLLHDAICAFARLDRLKVLWLWEYLPRLQLATVEALEGAKSNNGATPGLKPFQSLETLNVAIETEAVPKLAPMLASVTSLCLRSGYEASTVIHSVKPLVQLQSLELTFGHGARISARDLVALQSLTRLRSLSLRYANIWEAFEYGFRQLLACLPHLHTFNFNIWPSESSQLLRICGECCRQLRSLDLWGYVSLTEQLASDSSRAPLFPKLERLRVALSTMPEGRQLRYISNSMWLILMAS